MEERIDLNFDWKEAMVDELTRFSLDLIIKSLYHLTICKHETVLANIAVCIHNRVLSDDVLRCSGVIGWLKGNPLLIINKQLSQTLFIMLLKSYGNVYAAVCECIYKSGQ